MFKKIGSKFKYVICAGAICAVAIGWQVFGPLYRSLDNLPNGESLGRYPSPDKHYDLVVYRCSSTLSAHAIRGAIMNNADFIRSYKNIYWSYPAEKADVQWLDNKTVKINGVTLDVERDRFDFRTK
ncbi:MAG: DUF5412 family protein [Candidatus Obscuribacterales bacterium]|nr:DUF5412 family protein [Candidatus Obscuribacterales bacterium]